MSSLIEQAAELLYDFHEGTSSPNHLRRSVTQWLHDYDQSQAKQQEASPSVSGTLGEQSLRAGPGPAVGVQSPRRPLAYRVRLSLHDWGIAQGWHCMPPHDGDLGVSHDYRCNDLTDLVVGLIREATASRRAACEEVKHRTDNAGREIPCSRPDCVVAGGVANDRERSSPSNSESPHISALESNEGLAAKVKAQVRIAAAGLDMPANVTTAVLRIFSEHLAVQAGSRERGT